MLSSKKFDLFVMLMIALNTIVLAITWSNEPVLVTKVIEILNQIFTFIFLAEAIAKLIAFGSRYFSDSWNRFDFVIVLGSIAGFIANLVL